MYDMDVEILVDEEDETSKDKEFITIMARELDWGAPFSRCVFLDAGNNQLS